MNWSMQPAARRTLVLPPAAVATCMARYGLRIGRLRTARRTVAACRRPNRTMVLTATIPAESAWRSDCKLRSALSRQSPSNASSCRWPVHRRSRSAAPGFLCCRPCEARRRSDLPQRHCGQLCRPADRPPDLLPDPRLQCPRATQYFGLIHPIGLLVSSPAESYPCAALKSAAFAASH